VLLQELERFNALIRRMGLSLRDLQKALSGEIAMSNELDELSTALFAGELPRTWRSLAPATQKSLANWILFFLRRNGQYVQWVDGAGGGALCVLLARCGN
jgi:dynein heavy chain